MWRTNEKTEKLYATIYTISQIPFPMHQEIFYIGRNHYYGSYKNAVFSLEVKPGTSDCVQDWSLKYISCDSNNGKCHSSACSSIVFSILLWFTKVIALVSKRNIFFLWKLWTEMSSLLTFLSYYIHVTQKWHPVGNRFSIMYKPWQ